MTRVLITGCRHWHCERLAAYVVERLRTRNGPGLVIVHGEAKGVDSAFADAARATAGVTEEPHKADWDKHGRAAGPIRNEEMVAAGADLCLAVHRSLATSKGTLGCVRLAMAAGIPTWLIDSDDAVPRRIASVDPLEIAGDS